MSNMSDIEKHIDEIKQKLTEPELKKKQEEEEKRRGYMALKDILGYSIPLLVLSFTLPLPYLLTPLATILYIYYIAMRSLMKNPIKGYEAALIIITICIVIPPLVPSLLPLAHITVPIYYLWSITGTKSMFSALYCISLIITFVFHLRTILKLHIGERPENVASYIVGALIVGTLAYGSIPMVYVPYPISSLLLITYLVVYLIVLLSYSIIKCKDNSLKKN